MVSELGGSQISTLLETLPGIANVLRSPVADALGNMIRAAARVGEFDVADADELVRYATRRGFWAWTRATGSWPTFMRPQQKRWTRRRSGAGQKAKARAKTKPAKRMKPAKAVKKAAKARPEAVTRLKS